MAVERNGSRRRGPGDSAFDDVLDGLPIVNEGAAATAPSSTSLAIVPSKTAQEDLIPVEFGTATVLDQEVLQELIEEIRGGTKTGGPYKNQNFDGSTKMARRIKNWLHNYNSHIPDTKHHITKQDLMMHALALFFAAYPEPPLAEE